MLKIKDINVKGFRSFSNQTGFVLNEIRSFNLLIGKNNSGKSNITRLLKTLVMSIRDAGRSYTGINYILFETTELSSDDFFLQNKEEIEFKDWMISPIGISIFKKIIWSEWIKVNSDDNCFFKEMELNIKFENGQTICIYSCNISNVEDQSCHYIFISGKKDNSLVMNTSDISRYLRILIDSFIFIDEFRTTDTSVAQFLNNKISSLNLTEELVIEATKVEEDWNAFVDYINKGFKEIIKEELILYRSLRSNFNPANHLFVMYDDLPVKLSDLGSGISQILLFLTFIYRYRNRENVYVFIDEPELNIHPETIVSLFRFFTQNSNHQYFLLTHSSTLMDRTDFVDQIYMINRVNQETKATEIFNDKKKSRYLFDLIGVRPSQLLQSNCVIWIEGPSDRVYIRHWLNVYTKSLGIPELIEGKDYSFVMYGGALISYYDVDLMDFNKYIDLFSTSNNAYLVADSDLSKDRSEYKKSLQRLLARKSGNFGVWVTAGKEIENYVPHEVFLTIFTKEKGFKRKGDPPNAKKLRGRTFDKNDTYINFYSDLYDKRKKKKIKQSSFFTDKVRLAEKVTNQWDKLDVIDLKSQIDDLFKFIKQSNK